MTISEIGLTSFACEELERSLGYQRVMSRLCQDYDNYEVIGRSELFSFRIDRSLQWNAFESRKIFGRSRISLVSAT
jgi:hypothetical protein